LNLVFNRFAKCLEAAGVKQMEVIGEPFDPRLHEPVQEIESNEFADGAVIHELRRGYVYKDKVLRPALVNVTSNPSGVIVKKEVPPAATPPAAAASEAPATPAAPAAEAAATPAPATPAAETPAPPAVEAPAPPAVAEPAPPAPTPATTPAPAPAAPAPEAAPSPPEAQADAASSAPKKAIDKLKPTRPVTETQDLPIFKIEDFAESLAPEPDLEPSAEPEPPKASEEGTVYDITDVDVEDKPVGQEDPPAE
jgi:hypothetical protein